MIVIEIMGCLIACLANGVKKTQDLAANDAITA